MTAVDRSAVEAALREVRDPVLDKDLLFLDAVQHLEITGDQVSLTLAPGYPCHGIAEAYQAKVREALAAVPGVAQITLDWAPAIPGEEVIPGVRNIIAVASGKGGVGKSTSAVNLALALSAEGAKVGVLDADIYGPSIPTMLGIAADKRPEVRGGNQFLPLKAHGLQTLSMGNLVTEDTPMVWRGPMASGALQQLVGQTAWDDLDYLIVDMPPGTGDIQLTLAQKVPVTGAAIVTTPQDIALLDAKKGIEMFRKVNVPVLGVVENMAVHICSQCGHAEHIFGEGGGQRIAEQYDTDLLGSLPLDSQIREQTDSGTPTVAADPDGTIGQLYRDCARHLGARLWLLRKDARKGPEIVVAND